jgi:hypothetical protein
LLSNKEYLGSPRCEWDPMVFGLLWIATAVACGAAWPRRAASGMAIRPLAWCTLDLYLTGDLAVLSAVQVNASRDARGTPRPSVGGGGGRAGGGSAAAGRSEAPPS